MLKYLLRRLLFFIPTLVAISLLAFIISINAPGDPAERLVTSNVNDGQSYQASGQKDQKNYWRKKLGLDLPAFYFELNSLSKPAFINSISDDRKRNAWSRLTMESGNPITTTKLFETQNEFLHHLINFRSNSNESEFKNIEPDLLTLQYASSIKDIRFRVDRIRNNLVKQTRNDGQLSKLLSDYKQSIEQFEQNKSLWRNYIPVLSFHLNNQYHRWVFGDGNWLTGAGAVSTKGIIRGDFGISYQSMEPVSLVIYKKIGWSLFFSLASILLAYLISIPIGVWAGARKNSRFDKWTTLILFLLYSMPGFWVATLLLMTFANPDIIGMFPASGVKPALGYPEGAGLFLKIKLTFPYLILPLICYTYSSFAFISRTVRVSIIDSMSQDYIRTAYSKGVPFKSIVFKHAFKNSLLPLITIFANIFPLAIGGSVILETIFSIPGMGQETIQAIYFQNYPMIVAIFTISGFLTVVGYLVADILYAFADPRISFTKNSTGG